MLHKVDNVLRLIYGLLYSNFTELPFCTGVIVPMVYSIIELFLICALPKSLASYEILQPLFVEESAEEAI